MIITRKSMLTGIERSFDLNVTQEQLDAFYNGDVLLQNAFPHLSPSEREFIKTGIVDEEWDKFIPDDEGELDPDEPAF